jgi:hypothetical protein
VAGKRKSAEPPAVPSQGLAFAVAEFLSGLRLGHGERVLGALAIALAESLEAAPVYARAPLAGRLVDVLEKLEHAGG